MSQHHHPLEKREIYIKFVVQFSESNGLNPDKHSKLEDLLPLRSEVPIIIGETEKAKLQKFNNTSGSGGCLWCATYDGTFDEESSSCN